MHRTWVRCRRCHRLDFYSLEWPCLWCGGATQSASSDIGPSARHVGVIIPPAPGTLHAVSGSDVEQ
jgi:hypothetical protein